MELVCWESVSELQAKKSHYNFHYEHISQVKDKIIDQLQVKVLTTKGGLKKMSDFIEDVERLRNLA